MSLSECKTCGYRLPTSELQERFKAGIGKCPECNRTGKNIKKAEGGYLYVADGEFRLVENSSVKRYFVFAYNTYYPYGGLNDYVGSAASLEEAIALAQKHRADNYHIATLDETGNLVMEQDTTSKSES